MTERAAEASASLLERRFLLDDATYDAIERARYQTDVLVIGSGIAGLTAALYASRDRRVMLVTKGRISETSTWYAQGGIAGAVGEADSVELHLADTLVVGQGLCHERVVRAVVAEAPEALEDLQMLGVEFDRDAAGGVALAREGGHSLPRVLYSGDATGATIQNALAKALARTSDIEVLEGRFIVDLLVDEGRCSGALVLDPSTGVLEQIRAHSVVLATGGAGQLFRVTTNPTIATGDGVAAAWRAGAEIADLEFMQFHPTALDHDAYPRFLITEALRGEGAYLRDCDGERFMIGVHPLAELAPRDVVSREIVRVMRRCGSRNVWLDARHIGRERLEARFPTIVQACADAGYDLAADLVPVAPAAHYLIGGVRVDIDGRTSLPGLYASGEVAASGLHGANRLASNSLLEGLVFSRRIVRALASEQGDATSEAAEGAVGSGGDPAPRERALDAPTVAGELRGVMESCVGVTRDAGGLEAATSDLASLAASLEPDATVASLEVANLLTLAQLMAAAALAREETRGTHSRSDHPERDDEHFLGHIVWQRLASPRFVPLVPQAKS